MAWIIDQTGKLSINANNCSYIYIESRTNTIKAVLKPGLNGEDIKVTLGTYQDTDTCKRVLEAISYEAPRNETVILPLGGDVDTWLDNEERYF